MRPLTLALASGIMLLAQAPVPTSPAPRPDRVGELERLGEGGRDLMIVGVEAPGFDKLKASQRKYAYFLYRAAIAGNDIAYFQNHRSAFEIKDLLEQIYLHRDGIDAATMEGLEEYLKLVWAHHGQYGHDTHLKFVPRLLTFKQLEKAAKQAQKNGAEFTLKHENLPRLLARLRPHIFDAKVEPIQVNQVSGVDVVATSSNGLYAPGLTAKEIQALAPELQGKLNVRFALKKDKKGRKLAEAEEFKIGGAYGDQLELVNYWLEKALGYVDNEQIEVIKDGQKKIRFEPVANQRKALVDLITYFQTGDEKSFKDHSVAWLKTKSAVDYLNGFYEVYKDPRAVVGSYEANVSFRADSDKIEKLSQNALYFEAKMPWPDLWKRAKVEPPVASVVNVILETGDSGPMSPAAYNLPNYSDIRKEFGSKNVVLLNIESAQSAKVKEQIIQSFYLPEDQELIAKFGDLARQWTVYMHEVIGHGSGQPDAKLNGQDPAKLIGGVYSALEECRADCVALYQFFDPKVVEIGAVGEADQLAAAKAMYLGYLGGQLRMNGLVQGDTIREAHYRGRQLVLNYLIQPGSDFGVAVIQKDGHAFVQVNDVQKARAGIGEVLAKLQTFKSNGDKEGVEKFFADFGTKVNKDWQADAKGRMDALNLPRARAFVFPQLVPVVDQKNDRDVLKDVKLETKETFAEQMLRFSRWAKSRELAPK
ncbi:MAG: hypothetical protein KGN80_09195 [Acidobacteriota bacterium]|nr:hypothetical protein [Acidobacteriota bacterium]